jgi:hypothetical protein
MDASKKRGRPSMIPTFVEVINSTPEGQPVVLQNTANMPALAYHHRRNLAGHGIVAEVVAPGKEKQIGKGVVKNPTDRFALVAVGAGPRRLKGKWIKINREIVAV